MFNRTQTVQDLGDFLYRYKVRYESDDCEPFSFNGLTIQQAMLQAVTDSPELLNCGVGRFKEFRMFHDSVRWVIELTREQNENQGFFSVEKTTSNSKQGT